MNSTLIDHTLVFLAYIDYKSDAIRYAHRRILSYVEFRYKMVEAVSRL